MATPKPPMRIKVFIFSVFFLFVTIPFGAFIFSLKHPLQSQKITISFPTPTTTVQNNWQTFTNHPYGYEIQYPKGWQVKFLPMPESKTMVDGQYFNNGPVDYIHNKISLVVTSEPIEKSKKFLNYEEAVTGLRTIADTKKTTIQGREIIKATITTAQKDSAKNEYVETGKSYQILIPLKENTLTLHAKIEDKKTADQMLSTFRFLE